MGARFVKPMLTKDLEDESLLDDPRFSCEEKYGGRLLFNRGFHGSTSTCAYGQEKEKETAN